MRTILLLAVFAIASAPMNARQTASPQPQAPPAQSPQASPPSPQPQGTILFERAQPAPEDIPDADANSTAHPVLKTRPAQEAAQPPAQAARGEANPPTATDAERSALTFTSYDLDARIVPAEASLAVRAKITVRNDGTLPLARLPLQISSTLDWLSFRSSNQKLDYTHQMLDSDTDHTGVVNEALVALPAPLAPQASLALEVLYSGAIAANANRLERIGAPHADALASDWDRVSPGFTGLRGFGDVLWYPVASPALALGDAARLFNGVGAWKLRQSQATIAIRAQVEFVGDPPTMAVLDGVVLPSGSPDSSNGGDFNSTDAPRATIEGAGHSSEAPQASSSGVSSSSPPVAEPATPAPSSEANPASAPPNGDADPSIPRIATFSLSTRKLGFQAPSIFIVSANAEQGDGLRLYVRNEDAGNTQQYFSGAALVQPVFEEWFGPRQPQPLSLVDLPEAADQPFDAGATLFLPLGPAQPSQLSPVFSNSLTHAWFQSDRAWMSEGLAQFMGAMWTERTMGREIALRQLEAQRASLALAEPEAPADGLGQSLDKASDPVYYRTKAAYVWWMLRGIAGEKPLQAALRQYRAALDTSPTYFERLLEKACGKDLDWFFQDWVYHDRGLPDLSIAAVIPRQVEDKTNYLVAVEVANSGYAAAEVPVTLHSGPARVTQQLLVPARSSATTRILIQGPPDSVIVNDGSVPESRATIHRKQISLAQQP